MPRRRIPRRRCDGRMVEFDVLPCFAMTGVSDALRHHPLLAVVTLFGAGVLTSACPCIWPMIPITAGLRAGGTRAAPRRRVVGLTLTYVTGLALFYAVLGLVAGLSGSLFGTVGSNPWARFVIGNLLLLFGLAMLDVFPVSAPRRLLAWARSLCGA